MEKHSRSERVAEMYEGRQPAEQVRWKKWRLILEGAACVSVRASSACVCVCVTDLRHIEGGGHLLQFGFHCAVAEGPFQHRLLDAKQFAHFLQICTRGSRDGEEKGLGQQNDLMKLWEKK